MSNSSQALLRVTTYMLSTSASCIYSRLHALWRIFQAPFPPYRTIQGYQYRTWVCGDGPRRYVEHYIDQPISHDGQEERPIRKITSDSRTNRNMNPVQEVSTEKEMSSYDVEKIVRHTDQPTGTYYAVCWYSYGPRTTWLNPQLALPPVLGGILAKTMKNVNKGTSQQEEKRGQMGSYIQHKKTTVANVNITRNVSPATLRRSPRLRCKSDTSA